LEIGGATCTAALVAPSILLTAAHCVFNPSSHQPAAPGSLHFKLGYANGHFDAEANGTRVITNNDYDPILPIGSMGKDWALVQLDSPIGSPNRFLPLRGQAPDIGASVMLGGYSKDHVEELMADRDCHVLGLMSDHDGYPLIRHSCTATHGVSGAPLLVHDREGWSIGGIEVVAGLGAGGGASVLYEAKAQLEKMEK
jgi:protease YdgD